MAAMTAGELIRELETFDADSEILVAITDGRGDWQNGRPGVVYWDADAHKVIVEAEDV
jgi:hypothetical protein